jgi:hypothetical protein
MAKLFISYRRKSWPFTHRLADELAQRLDAEIFVDFTGIDEDDFERSILRNLRESDAVLLIVSEYTFAERIQRDGDWVRREIREALVKNIPMILVCVDGLLPPPGLPEDIADVSRKQGINFYPEYWKPAIENLCEFIVRIRVADYWKPGEDGQARAGIGVGPEADPQQTHGPDVGLLPPPFEWIAVPAGKVTLEAGGYLDRKTTFDVSQFAIAKYPITNAQFAGFVQVEGYRIRDHWPAEGWKLITAKGWGMPRYWQQSRWNQPDYPVVGVLVRGGGLLSLAEQ